MGVTFLTPEDLTAILTRIEDAEARLTALEAAPPVPDPVPTPDPDPVPPPDPVPDPVPVPPPVILRPFSVSRLQAILGSHQLTGKATYFGDSLTVTRAFGRVAAIDALSSELRDVGRWMHAYEDGPTNGFYLAGATR